MQAAFSTVDEYFAAQPDEVRQTLEQFRQLISRAAPDADEVLSYQMPAFRFQGRFVWYAICKNHYGLYVLPAVLQAFKKQLGDYELTKSTIRFPLNTPLPETLITGIIRYAVQYNLERQALTKIAKAK